MTYLVVCLSDLLEETDADRGSVPDGVLEPGPIPGLINVHVVLKPLIQKTSEKRLDWSNLSPNVFMVVDTTEGVATNMFSHGNVVGEEEIAKDVIP